ncbi:MAG: pentapeptide repeat-containing protein [Pseudonocardiaceae bacterium]
MSLDLTGALLIDFTLTNCQLANADFSDAQFTSNADFRDAQFTNNADFRGARFALDTEVMPPSGWILSSAQPEENEGPGYRYLVRVADVADAET